MSRSRIVVEFADRAAYSARIGLGLAQHLGSDVRALAPDADACLVVCDADSRERCLPAIKAPLAEAGFSVVDACVPTVDPNDAWACVNELHQLLCAPRAPEGAPVVVCAGVQASQLAAFAASTCGARHPLVLAPASLAAVFACVAVDECELDTGCAQPAVATVRPGHASIDVAMLDCASEAEREAGLQDLANAARFCDDDYREWQEASLPDIAGLDADALVLALTETISARANAIGQRIAARIR